MLTKRSIVISAIIATAVIVAIVAYLLLVGHTVSEHVLDSLHMKFTTELETPCLPSDYLLYSSFSPHENTQDY